MTRAPRTLQIIERLRPRGRQTAIVAIDGCGGAGKTTLANAIAARTEGAQIVRTDDFARPSVPGWDWPRMLREVLGPIQADRPGRYQRYDWPTDGLAEWHDVAVGGLLIVEGVSSMRQELGRYWDLAIWLTCSRNRRLERGVARDGEAARSQWATVWMPEEDRYVEEQHPEKRADLVLDGEKPFPL